MNTTKTTLTGRQAMLAAFILRCIAENGGHTMSYEFGASEITDALGYEYFQELNPTMAWLLESGLVGARANGEVWLTARGEAACRMGLKSFKRKEFLRSLSHSKWFQVGVTVGLAAVGWLLQYLL